MTLIGNIIPFYQNSIINSTPRELESLGIMELSFTAIVAGTSIVLSIVIVVFNCLS